MIVVLVFLLNVNENFKETIPLSVKKEHGLILFGFQVDECCSYLSHDF